MYLPHEWNLDTTVVDLQASAMAPIVRCVFEGDVLGAGGIDEVLGVMDNGTVDLTNSPEENSSDGSFQNYGLSFASQHLSNSHACLILQIFLTFSQR